MEIGFSGYVAATALISVAVWFFFFRTPEPSKAAYEKKFRGKVVLITGASSGLGKELAEQLSVYAPKLVLVARQVDKLNELKASCEKLGAEQVFVIQADVSKPEDCKKLVEDTVAHFSDIHVLFLNAGVAQSDRIRNVKDPSVLKQIMDTNYFGSTNVAFYALPAIRKTKGHIVVTSSVVSKLIMVGGAAYCASKAAVNSFFDCLRIEEFKNGVKVTIVCPGYVPTDILKNSLNGEGQPQKETGKALKFAMGLKPAVQKMIHSCVSNKLEVWYTLQGTLAMGFRGAFPNLFDRIVYRVANN